MDRYTDVETALGEVAAAFRYPPTPDLARAVTGRITSLPATEQRRRRWPPVSRVSYAAALLALLLAAALLVPAVRDTVAQWVHIHGLVIDRVPSGSLPRVSPRPSPSPGDLGDALERSLQLNGRTSLAAARSSAGFPVLAPSALGEPDRVYLESTSYGRDATLLYHPRPGLPPSTDARVGLLLTETRADVDKEFIQKLVGGDQTTIEAVRVGGVDGFWISGHPHEVVLRGADGTFSPAGLRLAGNTLLWERGGVTYRLESGLDRTGAIAIAESLR